MNRLRDLLALACGPALLLGLSSCREAVDKPGAALEPSASTESAGPADVPGLETVSNTHVHDMICGCALADVKKCGNYIKVGDAYLPLAGDLGLGRMEFCGKEGVRAKVTGEVQDGKFVATAFEVVE